MARNEYLDNRAYLAEGSDNHHGYDVRIQHPDGGYERVGFFDTEAAAAVAIDAINRMALRAEETYVR